MDVRISREARCRERCCTWMCEFRGRHDAGSDAAHGCANFAGGTMPGAMLHMDVRISREARCRERSPNGAPHHMVAPEPEIRTAPLWNARCCQEDVLRRANEPQLGSFNARPDTSCG